MPKKTAAAAKKAAAKKPVAAKKAAAKKPVAAKKPAKAPKKAAKAPEGAELRVKQVRSGIGHAETYRRTLIALGLRHHQMEITVRDNPSIRGMLTKVRHLVTITPVRA
ncbi:MAG: 50S ribosomal protein L30 [Gemmatimonadetes bacterium]|nr:50S ribosomal protein L30 [Gemmatimonadota bacterium]